MKWNDQGGHHLLVSSLQVKWNHREGEERKDYVLHFGLLWVLRPQKCQEQFIENKGLSGRCAEI